MARYAFDEVGKGLAFLVACRNVEEYEFVSTLARIFGTEFDGVTDVLDIYEVDTLDSLSVSDVEAWYNAFGYHGMGWLGGETGVARWD